MSTVSTWQLSTRLQVNDATRQATRIETVVVIRRPIGAVFQFATTPANWPAWHPASLAVVGAVGHSLDAGEQVTEEFRSAGRRGIVNWQVRQRIAPQLWVIEGGTAEGVATITYLLAATPAGTRFTRVLEYRFASWLWRWLDRLFIARHMVQESALAVGRLRQLLEAGERRA